MSFPGSQLGHQLLVGEGDRLTRPARSGRPAPASLGAEIVTSANTTKAGRAGDKRFIRAHIGAAGIKVDSRGQVIVDERLVTSNPKILAAGDVTTVPQFVYVAAEKALRPPRRRLGLTSMPRITFTTPPIASVGLTETQAKEAGHQVITSILPLEAVPRALVDHAITGLVKLVAQGFRKDVAHLSCCAA